MSATQDGRARAIEAAEQVLTAALDNEGIAAYIRHDVCMVAALLRDGMASRALLDALDAVPREHAAHEREWGNAHFADWQRERDRADAWMRACADLPCQHDPDNPCDDDWAFHQSTGEEVCNSCWARVSLQPAQERTS